MQINIVTPERIIRLIAGIVLLLLPLVADLTPGWTWVSVILGLVLVVTGVFRFCPAWAVLGIRAGGRR